ncbi:hypothetical protein G6M89_02785 [Natronolimnobius sp. AArcel1]|nr:hypothetical protein [Natronolimnobius sp. AArcel1]
MKRWESNYECKECEITVHPVSYRAACPDCGEPLQTSGRTPSRSSYGS